MRSVRTGPGAGYLGALVLLAALGGTVGLSVLAWAVGLVIAGIGGLLVAGALRRADRERFGPADWITCTRALLVVGVAALSVEAADHPPTLVVLVALSTVALVLDFCDGRVARRTMTASAFGARFDLEVDALLICVLSVYVSRTVGPWVLAIGLARYAFVAAREAVPWLRGTAPGRSWCKVVAAVQGVVLTVAATGVLPAVVVELALVASLALLVESFGREMWWLWHHRALALPTSGAVRGQHPATDVETRQPSRVRSVAAGTTTVLAGVVVWLVLVAPDDLSRLTPGAFVRLPLEGLALVAVALLLPARTGRVVAVLIGLLLGVLTVVKLLDTAFLDALDRPFNPVTDWGYFRPAFGVLRDSVGRSHATALVAGICALVLAILVVVPLSVLRLSRVVTRHRARSLRSLVALGGVWVLCAAFGAQVEPGAPFASTSEAGLAYDQVVTVDNAINDPQVFARLSAVDAFRRTPDRDLLTGLRGKDVIIAFVESYGQVAVQGSSFSPQVDATLRRGTSRLAAAGFSARSAFLVSPTFGGISWLAHSTLQSGLWVDSQQRYDELMAGNRFTLSDAFKRAGWRTVVDVPSNYQPWPQATSFYHYDKVYDAFDVGYQGPRFAYARMPDQFTLAAFDRLELAKRNRPPVMAEIDLVSSHTPWTPLPHMITWSNVGDGSVFHGMPGEGQPPSVVWQSSDWVKAQYGKSIRYSLNALMSFVTTYDDKNLVLVVLGDHQPATIVSGEGASHDVPVSIIAHDPTVLSRISAWGWQPGMLPDSQAPVWPMSDFRDRFLRAYSSPAQPAP